MTQKPINLHRSLAGLLVGNILAIFISSFVCILAWQVLFPEFYGDLREFLQARKEVQKSADHPPQGDGVQGDVDENEEPQKDEKGIMDKPLESPVLKPPVFNLAVWAVTLFIDLAFALLAGMACVVIAGFARNYHGMLLALLIVVWKIQQLIGFVDNHIPPSLILVELIGLPIACMVGVSLFDSGYSAGQDEQGEDEPGQKELSNFETS